MILNPFNSANLFNPFSGNTVGVADILSLTPAAWYRYGVGITVTGSGVSQWSDQSGNARHLLQGTDANRPALQADSSILFDGVNDYLATSAFTLNQPITVYILFDPISFTANDRIFDGVSGVNSGALIQNVTTPSLRINAGANVTTSDGPVVGSYGIYSVVFNGASSLGQLNNGTAVTGNAGAGNMGGLTLASQQDTNNPSNIRVKEVILFASAHDAATRANVIKYLAIVGDISI